MLCLLMLMLVLIILCLFHWEANPAVRDLSHYREPSPLILCLSIGRLTLRHYRKPFMSCFSHPAVGYLSSLPGAVHVMLQLSYGTTGDRHTWFLFHFIAHAMFMTMLTNFELIYYHNIINSCCQPCKPTNAHKNISSNFHPTHLIKHHT